MELDVKEKTAQRICQRLLAWVEDKSIIKGVKIPYPVATIDKELLIQEIKAIEESYKLT